jgi:hypothetical protein
MKMTSTDIDTRRAEIKTTREHRAALIAVYKDTTQPTEDTTNEPAPNIYNRMTAELDARADRSAWNKGVTLYALELVEELGERADYEKRNPATAAECREWLLNGARDWSEYSYGGSALIYDGDIAERLCTPSELKKKHGGELDPNSRETWLDTQARALFQAGNRVTRLYSHILKEV